MRRMRVNWIVCLGLLAGLLSTNAGLALQPQEELESLELQKVTLQDVALLAKSDLSDETTLVFLETRELNFELDVETLTQLRDQGVSDEVIQFLLKKSARSESSDDRGAHLSTTPDPSWYYAYPSWYYGFYYLHDPFTHYGHSVSHHWIHDRYRSDGHHLTGHSHSRSVVHSASHNGAGHESSRRRSGDHGQQDHLADGGSGEHAGSGHSKGSAHTGKRHGRRGYGGRRHGGRHGGGHRGGHGGGGH